MTALSDDWIIDELTADEQAQYRESPPTRILYAEMARMRITIRDLQALVGRCPECAAQNIHYTMTEESFVYGKPGQPSEVVLDCLVPIGHCDECGFGWSDWRAEDAKDEIVKEYLESKTHAA